MIVKSLIRGWIPFWIRDIGNGLYGKLKETKINYLISNAPSRHQKALKLARKREKIIVAFFVIHDSIWKLETVYHLMEKHQRFKPIIVICPYVSYGDEHMKNEMRRTFDHFERNGYNVLSTYNQDANEWVDVKKELRPDIVFFTNPHQLTKEQYYIYNFADTLTCYVPYAYVVIHLLESHYNQPFHNLLWKAFYETEIHRQLAISTAKNKGNNVVVTGYPSMDKIFAQDYLPNDRWKLKSREIKRVIWAPHHTIEGQGGKLDYSSFLKIANKMREIAKENIQRIQIAFKPHPLLKIKLYQTLSWGKDRTDEYYAFWENMPNGLLEEGDYIDLFMTSDALIHDSASFMVEYLYTGKPVAFTVPDDKITERFNKFGQMVFDVLYKIHNEAGLIDFIESIVINGEDNRAQERMMFFKQYVLPQNGKTASQYIFSEILRELSCTHE